MRKIHVDVVMANKLIPLPEARRVTAALERQVQRDFAKVWNVTADLHFVGKPENAHRNAWQLVLLDEEDDGAYGYHQLTRDGMPLGKVLMRLAMTSVTSWSSTASHELLELLVNPDTTLGSFVWNKDEGGRVYSLEVCDPCQDDPFCYRLDGTFVSDFVYPAWFETWREPGSARFDHRKLIDRPFQIAKGGYASFYDARKRKWVNEPGRGGRGRATPTFAPDFGYANRGGSRRSLRDVPRPKWKRSQT
jgi:hypothetical protein